MRGSGGDSLADGMTNKPLVSCAGDWNLFCTLEAALSAAVPQEPCEWRRSYGRVVKSVQIESAFMRYTPAVLRIDGNWNLLKRPVFHIYWTDCVDIESFKTTLKDDIEQWLKELTQNDVTDWMIVLVETYDYRKTNKLLPRTTVLDKIKGEFSTKQNEDRFMSVINPIKSESRSAESWRGLVARIRHFILSAYNKSLLKFEDYMREQREKRNEADWDFCKYFLLQEQLAFVLEMLSLYEEALVQYDELDALFTQFVLNSNVGDSPKWLATFQQQIESWRVVRLSPLVPASLRDLIVKRTASLLDLRSYLFHRQCAMLLLMFKPWEMGSRCISTVHNTIAELSLLEVSAPEGAMSCWAVLMCAETLRTCERLLNNSSNVPHGSVELCTRQHATLCHLAKDKLYELGKMCGLLPGTPDPSSDQLHLVVMLSAGMGDEDQNSTAAMERLKEALGSKVCFQQYYLELAELALGTYKHIGRHRCARDIGRQLAQFYTELGETGKAAVFLTDALRSYEEQGWSQLAAHTRLELVACAKRCGDYDKYTKLSATIASSLELEILVRNFYFDEMMKSIKKNHSDKTDTVLTELGDCFKIIYVEILPSEREVYITDNIVQCRMEIESFLPREIVCTKAAISIEAHKGEDRHTDRKTPVKSSKTDNLSSNSPKKLADKMEPTGVISRIRLDDLKPKNPLLNPLKITSQLHYKEDRTLDRATVECHTSKTMLKRSDSTKYRKPSSTIRDNYTNSMSCENFVIKPGINDICLECITKRASWFKLGQVSIVVEERLEFLSNVLVPTNMGFEVVVQGVSVCLNKVDPKKDLVTGLEHKMELVVSSGSMRIEENSCITVKTSVGLGVCLDTPEAGGGGECGEISRELHIQIPGCKPFETIKVPLRLLAQLQTKKDRDKSIEHTVWLQCPWWESATPVPLHFSPPLTATHRLLTSALRKFLHVTVESALSPPAALVLSAPALACEGDVAVFSLNPSSHNSMVLSSDGTTVSLMWELQSDPLVKVSAMKALFSVQYALKDSTEPRRSYACTFDISDYATLFVVNTNLEPAKGSEFCRASQMCHLNLTVERVDETEQTSLMYEVLADKTMWAVCGRTAGVVSVENERVAQMTLEVMPLVAGYLPLPTVRLSKYVTCADKENRKDLAGAAPHYRLEPFSPGQVYHAGKALQVHVLASAPRDTLE